MLPASNRGAGMNIGFPDVCLTPAGPAVVPIPYPNLAMNAQALGFSPTVKVSMVNALNLGSKIPMTSGDEAGSANPTIKGAGAYTMGNPIVNIDKLPGINLVCPTTGNNMNNPLGAVLVPSAVNVTYCRAGATGARVGADELGALADEMRGEAVSATRIGAIAAVRVARCGPGLSTEVFRRVRALGEGVVAIVLDLRQNPGGELEAAAALAADFLPDGALVARLAGVDGDETRIVAHGSARWSLPLVVLVDGGTASAAELIAASLQAHARTVVVGTTSYGKAIAQRIGAAGPVADAARATIASWRAGPDAASTSAPVTPDLDLEAADASTCFEIAVAVAVELADATSALE